MEFRAISDDLRQMEGIMSKNRLNLYEIDQLCMKMGWSHSEMARQAGLSRGMGSYLMKHGTTSSKTAKALADAFGVDINQITMREPNSEIESARKVPMFSSWAHAGLAKPELFAEKWLLCNSTPPDAIALKIQGDSMAPYFITGDVVICTKENKPESGNFVLVKLQTDSEPALKEIFIYSDRISFRSLNPIYPEVELVKKDKELIEDMWVVIKMIRDTIKLR